METSKQLEKLSADIALLLASGTETQESISVGAKVDQGLISRIKNGDLVRYTIRIERVKKYVDMLNEKRQSPPTSRRVFDAVSDYLKQGLDPEVLLDTIHLVNRIQGRARECGAKKRKRI